MLLVIDNFDSFTYNLVQYFGQLGVEQQVFRNNAITVEEALALNPDRIMISPGPCSPNEAGVSLAMIEAFAGKKPLLGVCLGHQSIGQHFGGDVVRAERLMHGKTSPVFHHDTDIFSGLPNRFNNSIIRSKVKSIIFGCKDISLSRIISLFIFEFTHPMLLAFQVGPNHL